VDRPIDGSADAGLDRISDLAKAGSRATHFHAASYRPAF
jgi:hypothetical protein